MELKKDLLQLTDLLEMSLKVTNKLQNILIEQIGAEKEALESENFSTVGEADRKKIIKKVQHFYNNLSDNLSEFKNLNIVKATISTDMINNIKQNDSAILLLSIGKTDVDIYKSIKEALNIHNKKILKLNKKIS